MTWANKYDNLPKDHNSELWKWYENGSRLKITWSNLDFKT